MDEKELNEIKNIVDGLDKRVSRDGARVQFDIYGGGSDEGRVQANQKGYLRLGIEFLKAAFAPPPKDIRDPDNIVDVDIDYLTNKDAPIQFDWFERRDDIPEKYKSEKGNRIGLLGCSVVILAVVFLMVMGVIALFRGIK